jgi:hypothetical protein
VHREVSPPTASVASSTVGRIGENNESLFPFLLIPRASAGVHQPDHRSGLVIGEEQELRIGKLRWKGPVVNGRAKSLQSRSDVRRAALEQ